MAKVFFAYPYDFDDNEPQYRVALREACRDQGHEAVFANAVPAKFEIMQHVHECIDECDAAFFDITGLNPSVLIEFGVGYAAGKSPFVLLNEAAHVTAGRVVWGKKEATPLPIPANLSGTIRIKYTSTHDLRQNLKAALAKYLPSAPQVLSLAQSIKTHLRKFGPLDMSGIANGVQTEVGQVRPVVSSLLATREVLRTGVGRWTKYELPH